MFQNFPHKSSTAHSSPASRDAPGDGAWVVSNQTDQTQPSKLSELHTSEARSSTAVRKITARVAPEPTLFFCVLEQRRIKLKHYGYNKATTEEKPKGEKNISLFTPPFLK